MKMCECTMMYIYIYIYVRYIDKVGIGELAGNNYIYSACALKSVA